jgi:hypothetical protein
MMNNLTANQSKEHLLVSIQTNGTNTQHKSTKSTSGSATQLTFVKSKQKTFPTLIYSLADSLAKHFQLPENGKGLTTQEELYFLKSLGFSGAKDRDIFYSKMSKVYLVMTKEKLSRQYLGFSPTWGMSINGRFLTAKISEFPRIGKECSLSDILEEHPDQKYFLSQKVIDKMVWQSKD